MTPLDPTTAAALDHLDAVGHSHAARYRELAVTLGRDDYRPVIRDVAARHGWPAAGTPAESDVAGRLVIRSVAVPYTGYGQHAAIVGRELERLGQPVAYTPVMEDARWLERDPFAADRTVRDPANPWVLQMLPPDNDLPRGKKTVVYTMWESSRLRPAAVDTLNRTALVVVPGPWNARIFRESGVTTPIVEAPLGVDAEAFADRDDYPDEADGPFRFGCAGRLAHGGTRKGIADVLAAFQRAFPNPADTSVALDIKVWPDCRVPAIADPRVRVLRDPMTTGQLADWYRSLSAYVTASRGEGWGLQTLQAMSVGRPVLAIPWSETAAFWDRRCGWELPYTLQPAGGIYAGLGEWAVPDMEALPAMLRWARFAPHDCRLKGRAAAVRAREFPWERGVTALRDALRALGAIPPRRRPTPRPPAPEPPPVPYLPYLTLDEGRAAYLALSDADRDAIQACPNRDQVRASCCGGVTTGCRLAGRNRGGEFHLTDCVRCLRERLPR